MSGFTCQICAKSRDHVEHNFLTRDCKVDVCDSCMKIINDKILKIKEEDEEISLADKIANLDTEMCKMNTALIAMIHDDREKLASHERMLEKALEMITLARKRIESLETRLDSYDNTEGEDI